jgi:hypothetical protein
MIGKSFGDQGDTLYSQHPVVGCDINKTLAHGEKMKVRIYDVLFVNIKQTIRSTTYLPSSSEFLH